MREIAAAISTSPRVEINAWKIGATTNPSMLNRIRITEIEKSEISLRSLGVVLCRLDNDAETDGNY